MQEIISYLINTPMALYFAVGVFSLCIGSFLNVVIYRTPKMMEQEWRTDCQLLLHPEQPIIDETKLSLSKPASTCPKCKSAIRWYQNVPVISWLLLRGKCGTCHNPISIRYPAIELLTAICALVVVAVFGPTIQMLFGLVLTYILITLTFIDFDTQLLPDRYTLTLAGLGLGVNFIQQPSFEKLIDEELRKLSNVDIHLGYEVVEVSQDEHHAQVVCKNLETHQLEEYSARFVVCVYHKESRISAAAVL